MSRRRRLSASTQKGTGAEVAKMLLIPTSVVAVAGKAPAAASDVVEER